MIGRLDVLLLVPAFVVLLQAAAELPAVGDGDSPAFTHVAPYYLEHAHEETGAPNFVTAVLADYRGYGASGGSPSFPAMMMDASMRGATVSV